MLTEREQKIYDQTISHFNTFIKKPLNNSPNYLKPSKTSTKNTPLIIPKQNLTSLFGSFAKSIISSMNHAIKETKSPSLFKLSPENKLFAFSPISPKKIIPEKRRERININDCKEEVDGEVFWDIHNLERLNDQMVQDQLLYHQQVLRQTEEDLLIFKNICKY